MYIYMYNIYNKILFNYEKEWDIAICDNMDEPWEHCIKWNKSDENQVSHNLTYAWNLKKKNNNNHTYTPSKKKEQTELMDTKNKLVVSRGRSEQNGCRWPKGINIQL